jgi:hypothetical protein
MMAKLATEPLHVITGAASLPSITRQNSDNVHPVPLSTWSILSHPLVAVECVALFFVPHIAMRILPDTLDAGRAGVADVLPPLFVLVPTLTYATLCYSPVGCVIVKVVTVTVPPVTILASSIVKSLPIAKSYRLLVSAEMSRAHPAVSVPVAVALHVFCLLTAPLAAAAQGEAGRVIVANSEPLAASFAEAGCEPERISSVELAGNVSAKA